jgi:hypothetical protein
MPAWSRCEAEQVSRACGLREPSRERVTQDRFSGARPPPTTVNHDNTTKTSSTRTFDAIDQEAGSGIAAQPVKIDFFLGFGFTPAECEELRIADTGVPGQAGLIGIGPTKGRGLSEDIARARCSRFACCPFDTSGSARDRLRVADEVGEAF